MTVNFRTGDELRQDGRTEAEELEEGRLPLQCGGVEQKGPGSVGDFAEMQTL